MAEKEALIQAAADEEKKIIADINSRALANLAEVREKMAKDVKTVRESLEKEIDSFAGAISEKILGRAI